MIKSVLVDICQDDLNALENILIENFPEFQICGKAVTSAEAYEIINDSEPDLIFINCGLRLKSGLTLNDCFLGTHYEVILLADSNDTQKEKVTCGACSIVQKPFQKESLIVTVNKVLSKIIEKQENIRNKVLAEKYFKQSSDEDVIGIPTIEGFEFILIKDIICCEGLQKCTRVITKEKTDIISSYNLGEFRKFLEPYGFFSPHKSHLINLKFIKNYHREGSIHLINGLTVPVAKRKKREFLDHVKHI